MVSWQATSAHDGHVTSGTFAFAVGHVSAVLSAPTFHAQPVGVLPTAANWLFFAGLATALGGLVAGVAADIRSRLARRRSGGLVIALVAAAIASVGAVAGLGVPERAPARVADLTLLAAVLVALTLALTPWVRNALPHVARLLRSAGVWAVQQLRSAHHCQVGAACRRSFPGDAGTAGRHRPPARAAHPANDVTSLTSTG